MNLSNIFLPGDAFVAVSSPTKAKALEILSSKASRSLATDSASLLNVLEKRELLGSTGIGNGIAVPHAPLPGLGPPRGFIFQLSRPLDFDAIDYEPVDLIFLLVFGDGWRNEYLKVLAAIARKAQDGAVLEGMRCAKNAAELYAIFTEADDLPAR